MEWLSKPRTWVVLGVSVIGLILLHQLWLWEVERVEVPADQFLVKINLWGKDLPPGEIVAPDPSYKGIQQEVLTTGWHFLNPILYSYERHKVLTVKPGECAVLTRKAGQEISPERKQRGEFLAHGDFGDSNGERGIVAKFLGQGTHFVNPHVYSYELIPAVEIKADEVGVRVLKWGADPPKQGKGLYVVEPGIRGVQRDHVRPGTHYINPHVEAIVPVNIRSHSVDFDDISFPSRDGFTIQPHVQVAYKVIPEKAPELFVLLTDQGKLPQDDATAEQQKKNPILQKVVLPLIRGYVRIEGSKYDARDYVSQQRGEKDEQTINPRERLQKELMDKVAPRCRDVGVIIETITVAQPEMNKNLQKLADAIAQRETTRVEREKNRQLVEKYKQDQKEKAKQALAEQRQKVQAANKNLEREKIDALKRKEVEQAKLDASLKAAQARLEGAKKRAEATVTDGKAEAAVIMARNEAEVAGLRTAIAGFPSADHFAQYHVLTRLSPALAEIFASDNSEFAKVFSTYMTPGARKAGSTNLPMPKAGGD